MRLVFTIIVILHGLIHMMGFAKAFHFADVNGIKAPITPTMGLVWLIASILLVAYGIMYLTHSKYAWIVGLIAVVLSQVLIIYFWKDAKFGTIPNILILIVSLALMSYQNFQNLIHGEVVQLIQNNETSERKVFQESDILTLPAPVQRWLRRTSVIGRPYITIGRVEQDAEMQLKQGNGGWMKGEVVQYTALHTPGFVWNADVGRGNLMNFKGRDKFVDGHGEMTIKVYSMIPVVNATGEKIDEGIIQSYLGEMVWFPTLATSPYISWEEIDANTAKATMKYKGTTGSGTFHFSTEGDFIKFTTLRYKDNDENAKRLEWIIKAEGYSSFDGVRVPDDVTVTWMLDTGAWTWTKVKITDLQYNENAINAFVSSK